MRFRLGFIVLLLLSVSFLAVWNVYQQIITEAVVLERPRIIEIAKGDGFNKITNKLLEQEIEINPLWFKLIAYERKISNKLKAGEYALKVGLTMPQILALFVEGKTRQHSITFPEGWNFKQIFERIQNHQYLKKTLTSGDFKTIMSKLGSNYKHPEGLFFPDTYFFDKNTSDFSLLKMAYHKMQRILATEWDNREKDLPLKSAYEALILASIIEKETGVIEERPQIAGVFTRRLKIGMLLQTDPTVIYGMGDGYKGKIRRSDLRRATAYNTYVIKGLPPTPIAMPGKAAINAALHPKKGKSLYFVAEGKGRGTHIFSATLRAHNNAIINIKRTK
ncbi:MAG: endolytic transglycosylase MltG [Methylococcales symbiont of Iophon sp. n. MRB-2018]|nr:MAG: endolytic transglycosylase MltG [Methylococcales symbiont of Iophon sp. n. MRB-2018]KAF3979001.1 MAG: endolytic transglycosylase MltG [Methylococcales symbiont of Iophon sp. n. MRB-2018]